MRGAHISLAITAVLLNISWICQSQTCPNSGRECVSPECCSKHGYCGTGDAWCGVGNTMFPVDDTTDTNTDCDCPTCETCEECEQCPICPGSNETYSPTPYPVVAPTAPIFVEHCHCHCYADPHCVMWNCHKNNYQGPHGANPAGRFYLITPCRGRYYNHQHLPFDVIAVFKRYDNDFTSIDYTIVKLYDDDGSEFCIKIKGNSGVSYNTQCDDSYPNTPTTGSVVTLSDKFHIKVVHENGAVKFYLYIEGDECDGEPDLIITASTPTVKEESVLLELSECYKRYVCGMCGNFYREGYSFERIDGSTMTLSEGCWGGTANHADGLSYLLAGTMGSSRRRLQDEDTDEEPCYGYLDELDTQCLAAMDEYSECCSTRQDYCDDMIAPDCKWDACACVAALDESAVTTAVVEQCAADAVKAAMNMTCMLEADTFVVPDVELLFGEEDASAAVVTSECGDASGVNIGIGIVIGCAIFIAIDCCIYFGYLKGKLDVVRGGYAPTEQNDSALSS